MADVKNINGYDIKDATARSDISSLNDRVTVLESALLSHVGMIIHSTTLDTEAKVKAIYGGTTWIQHIGYFLRGGTIVSANNNTFNNSAMSTSETSTGFGGDDSSYLIKHKHISYRAFRDGASGGLYGSGSFPFSADNPDTSITGTVNDGVNRNIPKYKSVYIWERTV